MIRLTLLTILLLSSSWLQAAMLPFSKPVKSSGTESALNASLNILLSGAAEYNSVIVKLKNLNTGEVITIAAGEFKVEPGNYELLAYVPSLEEDEDPSFTQYKIQLEIDNSNPTVVNVPQLTRRRYSTWADLFTISLQAGSLNGDYEVTSILNEYYTAQNIANSYPEINTLAENDSNAQTRTGLNLNYKHLFADSDWMMYAEWFMDMDSNQSLNRSGFGVGAGKYWNTEKSNYWLAGGVGSETAEWNNIHIGGDVSITISGSNDTQSLNLEAGIIYQPINTSFSVKVDLNNQTLMLNVGYVLGGKKQGYIDSKWVD